MCPLWKSKTRAKGEHHEGSVTMVQSSGIKAAEPTGQSRWTVGRSAGRSKDFVKLL